MQWLSGIAWDVCEKEKERDRDREERCENQKGNMPALPPATTNISAWTDGTQKTLKARQWRKTSNGDCSLA